MDALESFRDDRAHAQEPQALGRPIARRAGAVCRAGDDDERDAFCRIAHCGFKDRHDRAVGHVPGKTAFLPRDHLVAQADIAEGPAYHDLVINAARAVGIKIGFRHALRPQVTPGIAVAGDGADGRDVVGGDGIAENGERSGAVDVFDRRRFAAGRREQRRLENIGGALVPIESGAAVGLQALPLRIAGKNVFVALDVEIGR